MSFTFKWAQLNGLSSVSCLMFQRLRYRHLYMCALDSLSMLSIMLDSYASNSIRKEREHLVQSWHARSYTTCKDQVQSIVEKTAWGSCLAWGPRPAFIFFLGCKMSNDQRWEKVIKFKPLCVKGAARRWWHHLNGTFFETGKALPWVCLTKWCKGP